MNVLRSLAREHAAFAKLIARLEAGAANEEAAARREVRNTLLILLSALDRHEQVEETVFGNPSYASREGARRILDQIAAQHERIQELRLEFLETITSSGDVPLKSLADLVRRLAEKLRAHFETEEKTLWPHYENFSRSLDASIRRRLERTVRILELDVEANSAAIAEYLERKG